ncbi:glycerol kinase GlpK [Blastopirellula sp. JC732]|uniref:Glycerol kinase n=1 Tax=Blastopirellula sediminis TaxID=2894196 RepID=A0A9X1MT64_9BACT|nr:glycerol kinase GlpK [Blastopirellula sediminis]MCC9604662.1 glycerol kinase GlpK [Blastopirellula sediminis]MCC9632040.1 glycerol kinase GlpK [Blastopirellula sediminis]
MQQYILAFDQGTTSSRSIVFDHHGKIVGQSQQEFRQILPTPGHVEHDPEDIWRTQIETAKAAIAAAQIGIEQIIAIGVTNQRETTLLWDRATGKPVANAIVWQSRISTPICHQLSHDGHGALIREKSGLVVDPYFSGTKIRYLLDSDPALRRRAEAGELCFGTVDSFLLWRLTGGRLHVTDVTNASRTMLMNIHTLEWDPELLEILDVPAAILPEIRSCSEVYGMTDVSILGRRIPIAGIAGDQQAATFGQTCFDVGSAKNTYGTGAFMLMNVGHQPVASENNLLTTVGWKVGNQTTYCLEGSVFVAGAVVQWLRDGLGVIETSSDIEPLAHSVPDNGGVYFVPAFVGLGAPYWDPRARGTILGLTRGTTAGHIARAAVESMAFQTRDLVEAMQRDAGVKLAQLQVDGGAAVNDELMQFQADLLGTKVRRPQVFETTALGAAYLAGLAVGYWDDFDSLKRNWQLDREFDASADEGQIEKMYGQWLRAVGRSRDWAQEE